MRLREGETWENIEEELLVDCAQLTKANSIEGRLMFSLISRFMGLEDACSSFFNLTSI